MSNSHDEIDTAMAITRDEKSLVLEKQGHGAHIIIYGVLGLFFCVSALMFIAMLVWLVVMFLGGVYSTFSGATAPMSMDVFGALSLASIGVVAPLAIFITATVKFGRGTHHSLRGYAQVRRELANLREKRDAQGGDISLISEDVEGGELSMIAGEKGALSDAESDASGA